jgi:hypothetical protein
MKSYKLMFGAMACFHVSSAGTRVKLSSASDSRKIAKDYLIKVTLAEPIFVGKNPLGYGIHCLPW